MFGTQRWDTYAICVFVISFNDDNDIPFIIARSCQINCQCDWHTNIKASSSYVTSYDINEHRATHRENINDKRFTLCKCTNGAQRYRFYWSYQYESNNNIYSKDLWFGSRYMRQNRNFGRKKICFAMKRQLCVVLQMKLICQCFTYCSPTMVWLWSP